jgi:hypothetical protein
MLSNKTIIGSAMNKKIVGSNEVGKNNLQPSQKSENRNRTKKNRNGNTNRKTLYARYYKIDDVLKGNMTK